MCILVIVSLATFSLLVVLIVVETLAVGAKNVHVPAGCLLAVVWNTTDINGSGITLQTIPNTLPGSRRRGRRHCPARKLASAALGPMSGRVARSAQRLLTAEERCMGMVEWGSQIRLASRKPNHPSG